MDYLKNYKITKHLLTILAVSCLSSCKTENIYLMLLPQACSETVRVAAVEEKTHTLVIPRNRFSESFQLSDSVFDAMQKAFDEADRKSRERIKNRMR